MLRGFRAPAWRQFVAWALCGASAGFTLVGAFAVLAVRLGGANMSAIGAVGGAGAWGFVLGWVNRDGPGEVCTSTARGGTCAQEWAPWPFWLAGALLLVVSLAVFGYGQRHSRQGPPL